MRTTLVKINILLVLKIAQCSIDGFTYMDHVMNEKSNPQPKGEDACNPLYWYPRNIPEHCQFKNTINPNKPETAPIPMPIPVPYQPPVVPILPPAPPPPIIPPPPPPPMYHPQMPYAPTYPMVPPYINPYPPVHSPIPNLNMPGIYQYPPIVPGYPPQVGMVPGIPGIVTSDGGINILPFSDVYSELLQKHKQKIIHKKLRRVLEEYDDYPRSRNFRIHKRLRNMYYE